MRSVSAAELKRLEALMARASARAIAALEGGVPVISFVFRPGGVAGGNVYTSWPALVAAVNTVQGYSIIVFDGSLATCHIPAGTWTLKDTFWYGVPSSGGVFTFVTVDDGAHLITNSLFLFCIVLQSNATTPVCDFTAGRGAFFFMLEAGLISNAAGPFIHATSTAGVVTLSSVHAGEIGDGTHPVFISDAGAPASFVELSNHSLLFARAVEGAGTTTIVFDCDSQISTPQGPGANPIAQSSASGVNYSAANVANWSGTNPASVADALDRIAAKITPIP